jgi:hypothetical protein
VRSWARRTSELHGELSAIAEIDPRWWLLAGGAAVAEAVPSRSTYVSSNAEPDGDTFIGIRTPEPADWIADGIARAHAARAALRELDGQLPDQPLSVTIGGGDAARTISSALDVAAFAVGTQVIRAQLAVDIANEGPLADRLLAAVRAAGRATPDAGAGDPRPDTAAGHGRPAPNGGQAHQHIDTGHEPPASIPFVCVSIGDEALSTARHGHRRAWVDGAGPWLGLGRCGGLAIVSTCHMVVDGYGHAWLTAKIAEHHARLASRGPRTTADASDNDAPDHRTPSGASDTRRRTFGVELPPLVRVAEAVPLGVAWRELPSPAPRALPLAYALGRVLHRAAKRPAAKFSPTFQIPIAPGEHDDPERRLRRVVPSALSVRFEAGEPEPYESFEARARAIMAREAAGRGLCTRLLAAARAAPVSLAWKRRTFSSSRPRWLDRLAEVVGGRACLSRIRLDLRMPPACAVSSPARIASKADPLGSCVITVIDDGMQASITACGSGLAGTPDDAADLIDALLDELRREG